MASANFTYQDAVDQAREILQDSAKRRWSDEDIRVRYLPRTLMQLRADRPDAFLADLSALNPKPALATACAFADEAFNAFVEMLVAVVQASEEEAASPGQSGSSDARAERAKGR